MPTASITSPLAKTVASNRSIILIEMMNIPYFNPLLENNR